MTPKECLKLKWKHIISVCNPNHNRYEDVQLQEGWDDFMVFYKDMRGKYYRASKKWKNYKHFTTDDGGKITHLQMIRKSKEMGFVKENLIITSPSDRMKFHKTSKNIVLGDRVLGTRDIKNIAKKKGLDISLQVVTKRCNKNKPLFGDNRLKKFNYKGKKMSIPDIAKELNVSEHLISNRIYKNKESIEQAIYYAKHNAKTKQDMKIEFEGKKLFLVEIITLLSERHNIPESTLISRYYKFNGDFDRMLKKSTNKNAPYKKKIIAEKNGIINTFESISEASRVTKVNASNISIYLKDNKPLRLKGYKFDYA